MARFAQEGTGARSWGCPDSGVECEKNKRRTRKNVMKTHGILLGTLLVFGVVASAQETVPTPAAEVGFSYSYTRVNPGGTLSGANANGGFCFVEEKFSKGFRVVAGLRAKHHGHTRRAQPGNKHVSDHLRA